MRIFSFLVIVCLFICGCKSKQAITQTSVYSHGNILDSFEFIVTPLVHVASCESAKFLVDCTPSRSRLQDSTPKIDGVQLHTYPTFRIQGTRKRSYEEATQTTNTATKAASAAHRTYIEIIVLILGILIIAIVFRITKL